MNKQAGKKIEKMAYVCPAVGEWQDDTFIPFSDNKLDDILQQFKACGLTMINTERVAPFTCHPLAHESNAPLRTYLTAAERNGLGVVVFDDVIFGMLYYKNVAAHGENWQEILDRRIKDLQQYSAAFRGFLLWDEMKIEYVDTFNQIVAYIRRQYPELLVRTSCLPLAAYRQEGLGADALTTVESHKASMEETYRDYIWENAKEAGYFLYDWYPLLYREKRKDWKTYSSRYMVDGDWYENLEFVGAEAKKRDYAFETGITIQACSLTGWASHESSSMTYEPERREDVGFNAYTAMAYGVREIHYFNYEKHWVAENVLSGMVDEEGRPTKVYDAVKTVNEEIDRFAEVYLSYAWRDTFDIPAAGCYLGIESATDYGHLQIANVTGARTFIGHLSDADGGDAYMLANAEAPRTETCAKVTLTFDGTFKAQVYDFLKGETNLIDLTDGTLELTIPNGAGVLVVPTK